MRAAGLPATPSPLIGIAMSEQSRPLIRHIDHEESDDGAPPPPAQLRRHNINSLPNRSFIYPILGMVHLARHRSLHPSLISRVLPLCLLSLFTVFFMFAFLWLPHVFVLSLFHEPFPKSVAATMILSEAAAIVAIVAEAFMTEKQIVDVFDIVLLSATKRVPGLSNRIETMVKAARNLDMDENGHRRLGAHKVNPYQKFKEGLKMGVYFVLKLPLCLIPVVRTSLFLCMQGV